MNKRSISGYLEEDGAGGKSMEAAHVGHPGTTGTPAVSVRSCLIWKAIGSAACRHALRRRE